uniref:Uncharacterized protein n=1 Tax=Oryza punctata TaxID=4537 RepID=A0A0E0KQ93_ORYPU
MAVSRRSRVEVREGHAAGHVTVAVSLGRRRRLGEPLLELGEQGLVLLVQQQRLLAQPLVLLHDVAVLQGAVVKMLLAAGELETRGERAQAAAPEKAGGSVK